jgi:hypothetical protein
LRFFAFERNNSMKQFTTIEKLDTAILYILELVSSLSVLLLAFGLIASMANVLTKGSVLTDHIWMQQIWAWTQCIAIDASVAGTIIRTFRYRAEGEKIKTLLYAILSALLLFTAAIVSNIEAIQQTLNVTLDKAYLHVFVPVEVLIWVRSIAIVLLIVAHAMRHVQIDKVIPNIIVSVDAITPEPTTQKHEIAAQTNVSEDNQLEHQTLALPQAKSDSPTLLTTRRTLNAKRKNSANYERVRAYMDTNQNASVRDVAKALNIGISTANKWMRKVKSEQRIKESEQSA